MSEWWTYRIASFVLFSPRTYLRLCELYNDAVWPLHMATLAAGIAMVLVARSPRRFASGAIPLTLGALWMFTAWAFHHRRYATINWAAEYFALAFVAQAVLLAWAGATARIRFGSFSSSRQRAAVGIVAFALFGIPLLERLTGRDWHQLEAFGIAPDPTAVGTLGMLLLAENPPRWLLLAIPLAWCMVNGAFQWTLGFPEALALPVIASATIALRIAPARRRPLHPSAR